MKFPQQNINQSETRNGDKKLPDDKLRIGLQLFTVQKVSVFEVYLVQIFLQSD